MKKDTKIALLFAFWVIIPMSTLILLVYFLGRKTVKFNKEFQYLDKIFE